MKKLKSLHDLFLEEVMDLLDAEKQLVKALPKMAEAAESPELRLAFEEHHRQTLKHVERLEEVLEEHAAVDRKAKKCKAMEGLLAEGEEMIRHEGEPHVRDAGLIAAAQRVEHYEIAGYGCARTFARILGHARSAQRLQATLDEEVETDLKLTDLAESLINVQASDASR